jgi:hypothetical protein
MSYKGLIEKAVRHMETEILSPNLTLMEELHDVLLRGF